MSYYWELISFDGSRLEIPPASVELVKKKLDGGDPIHTTAMTIPANQVKTFRITSKPFEGRPLLEAAAQVFNEPIELEDGALAARWVTKPVSQQEYSKHFAAIPSYHKLRDEGGMVIVAFRLPVHAINPEKVDYANDNEIASLTR